MTRGRVLYFPVHNTAYPRNRRIREFLEEHGWECVTVERGAGRETSLREKVVALLKFLRAVPTVDVILLSEMSLKYAPFTWVFARVFRKIHVVDGFIGLYETEIEDRKEASPRSLRAHLARAFDRFAIRSADIYLVDTMVRKQRVVTGLSKGATCISLPVGAPTWARPMQPREKDGSLHVLYYGNYIPLHGIDRFVHAWSRAANRDEVHVTFIGSGATRAETESIVDRLGLRARSTFLDPVPESALATLIGQSDVVLGVFGDSPKAKSVIANKVWQGLACDRVVLTRASPALTEIAPFVTGRLLEASVESAHSMTKTIESLPLDHAPADPEVADRLEGYVRGQFAVLLDELRRRSPSRLRREVRV